MSESDHSLKRIRWRWGLAVSIAMMLLALFPQIHFRINRGNQWNGANAIAHPDEVAYSAYTASLIRGNPRRYDPYTGRGGEQGATSTPESLFSIQVVPAYVVAVPARFLGLSASIVFMIFPALFAFASSLAIFWFISLLTRDERFSAAAVLIILGLGTLVAGQGIARHVLNLNYLIPLWLSNLVSPTSIYHLPSFRFYQPAVAFPLFFVFCALVFRALTLTNQRRSITAAAGAGLTFALLIFSYFYLWTAAAAWLTCLCAVWLLGRSSQRRRTLIVFGEVLALAVAALFPYLKLLSNRAATVDAAQALVFTHRPDLFRLPEIIAAVVLLYIGLGTLRHLFDWRNEIALIAVSFALSVFVVFNQQIISGRSLQPIHYQWFIANYCALAAVTFTLWLWWRSGHRPALTNRRLALISCAVLVWGLGEVWLTASVGWDYNRTIDEGKPVLNRLAGEGQTPNTPVVLIADLKLADRLPTDAPQALLWAPRMLVFPGVNEAENRERFWQQLYYLGYDEGRLRPELNHPNWNFLAGMFPYYRLSPAVSGSNTPITPEELRVRLTNYFEYARSFNRDRATSPRLSYLVVHAGDQPDYANLDRWYQRDGGEKIGDFIFYRLRLRE